MKKFIAVLMAFVLMLTLFAGCSDTENTEKTENSAIALKVGEMEFTVNDVNFMYISLFNQLYSNVVNYYGDYASTVVDISKPLEDQLIDDATTWHDYLLDYCLDSLTSNAAIYTAAKADADFTLPEDLQTDLDTLEEQLTEVATQGGYTLEEYVKLMYGEAMDMETLKKMNEFQYVSYAYQDKYYNSVEVSPEDAKAYYEEHKNDFDKVNFRYYSAFYSDEEGALTSEEALAQAEALAEVHTAEEFNSLVYSYVDDDLKSYFEEGDATLFPGAGYGDTGIDEVSEWLFDSERKQGDTMVYTDENAKSHLVVMFEERISADYNYVNVRHILAMPEEAEDGTVSEEAWKAAEEKAADVFTEYLDGEMTEDSFAALAVEHSEDGNAAQGGIYENVYKNQMVTEFNDWCFDPARVPGDTGIVKTKFGYHVMYFSGIGDSALLEAVSPAIVEERFVEWADSICEGYEAEKTELYETVGGIIDDIVAAAQKAAEESATEETGNVTNEEVVTDEG